MSRPLNLRQIEIFKGLLEHGTVSRAAESLAISQPAASKLLMALERDTGLRLFDRRKGRLSPTSQGLRLYEEVDRIFAGLRQVESAVEVIRREDQERISIGVIPALSGTLIQRVTMEFLARNPGVHCSITSMASRGVGSGVALRKIDVGIVSGRPAEAGVHTESLLSHPLVCIMPDGHALCRLKLIRPENLAGHPFVAFEASSYTGQKIAEMFTQNAIEANVVLTADVNPTVCMFVAAGLGVSLVHPLFLAGFERELIVRPFSPEIPFEFQLCSARDSNNSRLVTAFATEAKRTATAVMVDVTSKWD